MHRNRLNPWESAHLGRLGNDAAGFAWHNLIPVAPECPHCAIGAQSDSEERTGGNHRARRLIEAPRQVLSIGQRPVAQLTLVVCSPRPNRAVAL